MNLDHEWLYKSLEDLENSYIIQCYKVLRKRKSMMEICNMRTKEKAHSAFLNWIFCYEEFCKLPDPPIVLLLRLYLAKSSVKISKEDKELIKDIINNKIAITAIEGKTEVVIADKKRVDIEIKIKCTNPERELLLCIENKIHSSENNQQCNSYRQYYESHFSNSIKIYIYLSPDEDNNTQDEYFVHLLYKDIYEGVLIPILTKYSDCLIYEDYQFLKDYINTLTSINNTHSPIVMSTEYNQILKEIYNNYRELFFAAIKVEGTDEEREALDNLSGANMRYVVYLNNEDMGSVCEYTKMAYLVIKILAKNLDKGMAELVSKLGTVEITNSNIDRCVIATKENKGAPSRYTKYLRTRDKTPLWISNQWNSEKADAFIRLVQKEYPEIIIRKMRLK